MALNVLSCDLTHDDVILYLFLELSAEKYSIADSSISSGVSDVLSVFMVDK